MSLTPARYEQLSQRLRLPAVLDWSYTDSSGGTHALVARARGNSPAVALDKDGYEYAIGCGIRPKRGDGLEYWDNGVLTHVSASRTEPKWEPLAGAGETPHHTIDANAIRSRHGADKLVSIREWVDTVQAWSLNPKAAMPRWLVLHGPTGCGKTSAMRFIQREFAGFGIHAPFRPWRSIVEAALVERKESGKLPAMDERIMLIDDIGADNASAFSAELLYVLTDKAEQDGQVLCFTSNLMPADLVAQYRAAGDSSNANAERAVSRIQRRSLVVALRAAR